MQDKVRDITESINNEEENFRLKGLDAGNIGGFS